MHTFETLSESYVRQLPELEQIATAFFRQCREKDVDEALQNTRALAWKSWLKLAQKGSIQDEGLLRSVWYYAMRQQRVGRTITGGDGKKGKNKHDVFDRRMVVFIDPIDFDDFIGDTTPVPDQVAFRLDTPRFLATLTEKQRRIALMLAEGMQTGEIAKHLGVTAAVVSQCKALFKIRYDQFFADAA